MAAILEFFLGNFTLTFLVVGFITAAMLSATKPKPLEPGAVGEAVLARSSFFRSE
jgi:hypothetical protein